MLKRGHLILFSLVIVFGLPFVASWFLLNNPELLPEARSNKGRLITPPVSTPLTGAWTLLVPAHDGCDTRCRRVRAVAILVRRALGAESRHVAGPVDCGTEKTGNVCASVIAAVGAERALVIVDPLGNAMMSYDAEVAPGDLLKDVQRLLKVSREWRFDGDQ